MEIRKNHAQVIAGIKHIIDEDCYGEQIELVFFHDFTHFKKREKDGVRMRIAKPISDFPDSFWRAQDALRIKQEKEKMEKENRKDEFESKRKKRGKHR